jgi:hypothetical protein
MAVYDALIVAEFFDLLTRLLLDISKRKKGAGGVASSVSFTAFDAHF